MTALHLEMKFTPHIMPLLLCLNLSQKIRQSGVRLTKSGAHFIRRSNGGGYQVIRSSLAEGQDFFKYEPEHWDIMISNPPFSKKDDVLQRAFEFGKPFALLLPCNSIQGKKRFKIFRNEIQMLCFDARIDYHTNGNMITYTKGNHFGSAYFCRNFLPSKLEMRELYKYEKPLTLT